MTGKKSNSAKLQQIEKGIFREALENATDAIGMSTPAGRHYYQNKAFTDLFGFLGENPPTTLYCDEKIGKEIFQTIMAGGTWSGEVDMYARDRRILNILLRAYAIKDEKGNIIGLVGIHTDITKHKLSEQSLRESEAKFKAVFDLSVDALHLMEDGIFIASNESAIRMYGYNSKEEMMGETPVDISPERQPDGQLSSDKADYYIQKALHGEPQRFHWIHRRIDTGECFDVEVSLSRITLKNKHYLLAAVRNITEQKRMEKALKHSEATYREIFSNVNDTIWIHDIDTFKFIDVNDKVTEMFGYSTKEALELSVEDISSCVHPFTREEAVKYMQKAKDGETQLFEWHCKHKDGHLFWTEVSLKRATIAGRDCLLAIERDITERKQAEDTLRRIHSLESLGTIAGGIAHDFNNLLTGVFGSIELAEMELPEGHPASVPLRKSHKALTDAKYLTSRLLTFAKGGSPVLETVDLRKSITETVQFHLTGSNVAAQFEIPENLWPAKADSGQMGQVISNLTLNAKNAMPAGGTFHVHGENISERHKDAPGKPAGPYIKLTFRDEGIGIPENIIGRIFDPYFSTTESGRGLGLAIVHSIIIKHKGHINVTSESDSGTTFTLFIPAETTEHTLRGKDHPTIQKSPFRSSLHVLIMDDEPVIRDITSLMLQRLGCKVEKTGNGMEALEKYNKALKNGSPFDLVILDLTIPGGMGGKEAGKELLALDPTAKIIVTSGYFSDSVLADYIQYGFSGRLVKPFIFKELSNTISDIFK